MIPAGVEKRVREGFESLSPGMRKVGRYVLEHPEDVALLSMREQSRRAGVPPATMTRFAQRLGYAGYDEVRGLFANAMRGRVSDFGQRGRDAGRASRGTWRVEACRICGQSSRRWCDRDQRRGRGLPALSKPHRCWRRRNGSSVSAIVPATHLPTTSLTLPASTVPLQCFSTRLVASAWML